jgi:hypothetical protein
MLRHCHRLLYVLAGAAGMLWVSSWAIALLVPVHPDRYTDPATLTDWAGRVPADWPPWPPQKIAALPLSEWRTRSGDNVAYVAVHGHAYGISVAAQTRADLGRTPNSRVHDLASYRVGWPMRCLTSRRLRSGSMLAGGVPPYQELSGGVAIPRWFHRLAVDADRPLPIEPIPVGFSINVLVYCGVLYLISVVWRRAVRWHRVRQGRCAACNYALATEQVLCPECGRGR